MTLKDKINYFEGKIFNEIKVLGFDHTSENRVYFLCECIKCAKISIKSDDYISNPNKYFPCNCIKTDSVISDFIHSRHGSLYVEQFDHIEDWPNIPGKKVYFFKCKCMCGKEVILPKAKIKMGRHSHCSLYDKMEESNGKY